MTLRVLLVLVVLANGLFFAWSRGAFSPAFPPHQAGVREPERLAAQIRPDSVVVLPAPAASAAISAARAAALVCLEAGPFSDATVAAGEAALAAASLNEGSWRRDAAAVPPPWLVFAGRAQDGAGLRARAEELKTLGLAFEVIDTPAELANGFVLSRHADKAAAEAALAAVAALGLRGGRVVQLPAPAAQYWLRVPRADAEQQDKLKLLAADALEGGFKPCASVTPPASAASSASAALAAPAASGTASGAASGAARPAAAAASSR